MSSYSSFLSYPPKPPVGRQARSRRAFILRRRCFDALRSPSAQLSSFSRSTPPNFFSLSLSQSHPFRLLGPHPSILLRFKPVTHLQHSGRRNEGRVGDGREETAKTGNEARGKGTDSEAHEKRASAPGTGARQVSSEAGEESGRRERQSRFYGGILSRAPRPDASRSSRLFPFPSALVPKWRSSGRYPTFAPSEARPSGPTREPGSGAIGNDRNTAECGLGCTTLSLRLSSDALSFVHDLLC